MKQAWSERERALVLLGLERADLAESVHLVPAALDRGERPGQQLLEVSERGVDVVVDLVAQALRLGPGLTDDPGRLVLGGDHDLVDGYQPGVLSLALGYDPLSLPLAGLDDLVAFFQQRTRPAQLR